MKVSTDIERISLPVNGLQKILVSAGLLEMEKKLHQVRQFVQ